MTLSELIFMLENRIANLSSQITSAQQLGDVVAVDRLTKEIQETESIVLKLKS